MPKMEFSDIKKRSQSIKVSLKKKSTTLQRELEKSHEGLADDIFDPASHSHKSIFRLCDRSMLIEVVHQIKNLKPSAEIAKYLYANSRLIREKYEEMPDVVRARDGTPKTIARSIRLLREKILTTEQRYPEFCIDVYLQKKEVMHLDVIREILALYCLQKERICAGHKIEMQLGMPNTQVTQDIVVLRQLLLDLVKLCQLIGVELTTSYMTTTHYHFSNSNRSEEGTASIVDRLNELSKDAELLNVLRRTSKVATDTS